MRPEVRLEQGVTAGGPLPSAGAVMPHPRPMRMLRSRVGLQERRCLPEGRVPRVRCLGTAAEKRRSGVLFRFFSAPPPPPGGSGGPPVPGAAAVPGRHSCHLPKRTRTSAVPGGAGASWSACSVSCRFRPLRCRLKCGDSRSVAFAARALPRAWLGQRSVQGIRRSRDQSGS